MVAEGAAAPATAGAYTLASRSPKRLTGQIEFSIEDLAVFPQLETDLSAALQASMSNTLDEAAFNGTGGTALSGLFHQATNVSATGVTDDFSKALAAARGACRRSLCARHGRPSWRGGAEHLRALHGPVQGFGHVAVLRSCALSWARLVVSDRMPAVSSGAQKGIVTRNAGAQPIRIYTWGFVSS